MIPDAELFRLQLSLVTVQGNIVSFVRKMFFPKITRVVVKLKVFRLQVVARHYAAKYCVLCMQCYARGCRLD